MKGNRKRITFHSRHTSKDVPRPFSASRLIPDWYRKMKGVENSIMTVKKCVPFLDALSAGYIITLSNDMVWDKAAQAFVTNSLISVNHDHEKSQTQDVPLPDEYDPQPHKWINNWHIKTPPGYSTLFIHPLSRLDLPFYSFSAIVDTDKHPLIINFPFVMRKDFDGVIPAGTPIIQAIPFKRDDWDLKTIDSGKSYFYAKEHETLSPPWGFYKKHWWSKKSYSQAVIKDGE